MNLLTRPMFFGLTPLDGAVLLVVGVLFSGAVWFVTDAVRRWRGWVKPYTDEQRTVLFAAPIAFAALAGSFLFPVALEGVGVKVGLTWGVWALGLGVGAVGGVGSKVAHDHARQLLDAAFGRVLRWIGGEQ